MYALHKAPPPDQAQEELRFARHDLVWLSAPGWSDACARASEADATALARWQQNDWPAIVRRRDADLPGGATPGQPDQVCLGIPLPPDPVSGVKPRIALRVPHHAVRRSTPPRPLFSCVGAAEPWQAQLGVFCDRTADLGLRVFGSLAMQAITGLPCFTPRSDIDLLFAPRSVAQLERGLELLAHFATHLPLDGEIVFPNGGAVSWKEWLAARIPKGRVLVKTISQVRLADPCDLLQQLEPR